MRAEPKSAFDAEAELDTIHEPASHTCQRDSRADIAHARNEQDEEFELDRGETRPTVGGLRQGQAETDVRLTALVPRLTSPSRSNSELVDIWFSIERRHRSYEWDDAFARIAEEWRLDKRHQGHFGLFSHPASSALIVAREVSPDRSVWREIEAEARALVSRVNRAVAEQATPPMPKRRSGGWSLRGRDDARPSAERNWLGEAMEAIRALVPKSSIPVSQSSSTGVR
jgi:hypothetical protein